MTTRNEVKFLSPWVLAGMLLALEASTALAAPLDLQDLRPRWVAVQFEVSPHEQPARLDAVYTAPSIAWFEPAEPGRVRLLVSGDVVEQYLMPDQGAEPGTFSDFVWVFESATGRVVSASMSGTVRRTLDWGFFRSSVSTKIHVEMTTDAVAGFSKARRFLGQTLFDYCDPSERSCTQVLGRRYDPERGYVNAVGSIDVRSLGFRARAFSPLGEALFSELPPPTETTLTEVSPGEQPTVHTLVAP